MPERPTPKILLSYDSFLGFIDGSVVKNLPAGKLYQHNYMYLGFPLGLVVQESPCNEGDLGSIPGLGNMLIGT